MKYQIGDKIIVLFSEEEGTVVDIINESMVMIDVKGVKFPAYMDQIDFPYFKMFSQKKAPQKMKLFVDDIKKEKSVKSKPDNPGVYLYFTPVFDKDVFDDDVVDKIKVYLLNHNDEDYKFKYEISFVGESDFQLNNTIHSHASFYLNDINFEDVSDNPKFNFVFSLLTPHKKKAEYYEASLKTNGKKIFKQIEALKQNNEASFQYLLFETYPDKQKDSGLDLSGLGQAGRLIRLDGNRKEHLPPARSVVDIHIEKLMDNYSSLSNYEIMQTQLSEFEKYYELAVLHKLPQLIIIHGIGEGKLRDEIHERLRLKSEVKSFVNQYHHLYGYGATEIFFKKR